MFAIKRYLHIVLYRILLDVCYYFIISPNYSFLGYVARPTIFWYICSWIVYIFFIPTMSHLDRANSKASNLILLGLLLLAFAPFTTLVGIYVFNIKFVVYSTMFWFTVTTLQQRNVKKRLHKELVLIEKKTFADDILRITLVSALTIVICFILYLSMTYRGFAISFDLENVYETRFAMMKVAIPSIIRYIRLIGEIVLLIMIAYCIWSKHFIYAIVLSIIQLLNFGIAEDKAMLFKLLVVVFTSLGYRKYIQRKIILWMNLLVGLSIVEYYVVHSFKIAWLIIWRAMFIPNMLSSYYFDFFTKHTPDYFAQSFLRHFGIVSKYPTIQYLISEKYVGIPESFSNNGLIADAITNFGIIGMFALPIVICVFLGIIDKNTRNLAPEIYLIGVLQVVVGIQNMFFATFLVTGGGIIMCIYLNILSKHVKQINLKPKNVIRKNK